MFGSGAMRRQESSSYATRRDFCQIFEKNMPPLYLLSFLLTADQAAAEQCFVGGLDIAQEGNLVFKEWAESWARRTIILNAVRMIRPRLISENTPVASGRQSGSYRASDQPEIAGIVALRTFERFVFVMSVLEGYSDHECSLHLNCTVGDVRAARTRALEQLGKAAEVRGKLVTMDARQDAPTANSGPKLALEASQLAASA